jgi:SAM-dependent methyltransferase
MAGSSWALEVFGLEQQEDDWPGMAVENKLIMGTTELFQRLKNRFQPPLWLFRFLARNKPKFECPVCVYQGPFEDMDSFAGRRRHVRCPQCGALERHRLQYLVVMELFKGLNVSSMTMLHFAPEPFLKNIFARRFARYETADLTMKGVDHQVDLQSLPFADGSYDFVFASHVLEHVPNDKKAIQEIRRILKPNGLAVLPVPVVCPQTIEYPEANPHEAYHVRAPGLDYFEKYKPLFARVETHTSDSFPQKYQVHIYEDRSVWPTKKCPLRPPMAGEKHIDVVPVCYV